MVHLMNMLLILLFVAAVLGADLLLERYGRARFMTWGSIAALVGGGASGWLGLGMVRETLPFGGQTAGIALLVLASVVWIGLIVRNFKVAAPPTALAGTALQAGVGYLAGPSLLFLAMLAALVLSTQIFRLLPTYRVVATEGGKPLH